MLLVLFQRKEAIGNGKRIMRYCLTAWCRRPRVPQCATGEPGKSMAYRSGRQEVSSIASRSGQF